MESRFSEIGENLSSVIQNARHGTRWDVEKHEVSTYAPKIAHWVKVFEGGMEELCKTYHLPGSILSQHLNELWKIIANQLQHEYSQITPVNKFGRQAMARDVQYLISQQQSNTNYSLYLDRSALDCLLEYINAYFYDLP